MKNLKRVLSLALASVMLMGMMVVGSNAAIADVDADKHNVEALEVLKLVGAMVGDGTNISPDRLVTRNEAAVVVSNLLGVDKSSYKTHPFTDVPSWADSSVAVCYAEGITGGISATEFGGNNTITTLQAGLFVLKALGYFQYSSDFSVDGWEKATTKAAAKIDLFDGVSAKAYEGLTRNDFAQIVFNALNSKVVAPDEGRLGIDGNGNLATIYGYENAKNEQGAEYTLENKLFTGAKDLVKGEGVDDAGRPTITWTQGTGNSAKSVAIAIEPAYTFTVEKAASVSDRASLEDAIEAVLDLEDEDFVFGSTVALKCNGNTIATADCDLQVGSEYELYTNANDEVVAVCIIRYDLLKVGASTELTEAQIKTLTNAKVDEAASKATIALGDSYTVYDVNFADYDYAKDQYILAAVKANAGYGNSEIVLASKAATLVTGEVDAVKGSTYRIGDTFYGVNGVSLTATSKGTWALDAAGKIAAVIDSETVSSDYAFIYRIVKTTPTETGTTEDGMPINAADAYWTAYVVLADGTKASYVVAVDEVTAEEAATEAETREAGKYINGTTIALDENADVSEIIAYEFDKDGKLQAADAASDDIKAGTFDSNVAKIAIGEAAYYSTADTEFVFVKAVAEKETSGLKRDKGVYVDTVDSYKEVIFDVAKNTAEVDFIAKDGKILTVFVLGDNGEKAAEAAKIETTLAVMLDKVPVVTGSGSNTVYTYAIWADGKETTLAVKTSADKTEVETINNDTWFTYYTDINGAIQCDAISGTSSVDVVVEGDYAYIGGTKYALSALTLFTQTYNSEDQEYTYATGASLKAGDTVMIAVADTEKKIVEVEGQNVEQDVACAWFVIEVITE